MRYEVKSELNPEYEKTGRMSDYHGIYSVVEYDRDIEVRVVKTFSGDDASRAMAYQYAGLLQEQVSEREKILSVLARMEHAVNRSVSGMRVDVGEWLKLIHDARTVLGDKVIQ